MSTFTKEQLIARINQVTAINKYRISRDPDADGLAMDNELFAIAMASLKAKPVAWRWERNECIYFDGIKPIGVDSQPLYTAPPAPVSVPECFVRFHEIIKKRHHGRMPEEVQMAFDDCAAMLQGAEPVNKRDDFPFDYLQGQKDGLEWAARLAEANHPQTGDWLYDDPLDLAKAIRKGPDMPEAADNSPAIPDGYALVPVELTCEMDEAAWDAYHDTRTMSDIWSALLAAAPLQEAK